MARVTVEDCLQNVDNLFQLVLLASQRARRLANGAEPTVPIENDKVDGASRCARSRPATSRPRCCASRSRGRSRLVPDADNESTFRAPQFGLIDREL